MTRLIDALEEANLDPNDSVQSGLEKIVVVGTCRRTLLQLLYPDAKALLLANEKLIQLSGEMKKRAAKSKDTLKNSKDEIRLVCGGFKSFLAEIGRAQAWARRVLSVAQNASHENKQLRGKNRELKSQIEGLSANSLNYQGEINRLRGLLDEKNSALGQLEMREGNLEREKGVLKSELDKVSRENADLKGNLDELEGKNEAIRIRLSESLALLTRSESELRGYFNITTGHLAALSASSAEMHALKADLSSSRAQVYSSKSENLSLLSTNASLVDRLSASVRFMKTLSSDCKELGKNLVGCVGQISAKEDSIVILKHIAAQFRETVKRSQEKLDRLSAANLELTTDLDQTNAKLDELSSRLRESSLKRSEYLKSNKQRSIEMTEKCLIPLRRTLLQEEQNVQILVSHVKVLVAIAHRLTQQNSLLKECLLKSRESSNRANLKRTIEIEYYKNNHRKSLSMLSKAKSQVTRSNSLQSDSLSAFRRMLASSIECHKAALARQLQSTQLERAVLVRHLDNSLRLLKSNQQEFARSSRQKSLLISQLQDNAAGQKLSLTQVLADVQSMTLGLNRKLESIMASDLERSACNSVVTKSLSVCLFQNIHLKSILKSFQLRLSTTNTLLEHFRNESEALNSAITLLKCRSAEPYIAELERRSTLLMAQLAEANIQNNDMLDLLKIKLEQDVTGRVKKTQALEEVRLLRKMFVCRNDVAAA